MKKGFLILILFLNFSILNANSNISYIDINLILNNSIVGKSISKHIKEIKDNKNKEFSLIEKKLLDKEKDLIKKKNIVKKDEFDNEVSILTNEINKYRDQKNKFNNEIEEKKIKYTKIVLETLNPIISKYVEDNSITIVFPKKNIIVAKKNLDITDPIIELLNNKLKKIDF